MIAKIKLVLNSLKVGKGGKGQSKALGQDWSIGFYENNDKEFPFILSLRYKNRKSDVGLTWDDVYTKTKSMWQRDSVWRLKLETVNKFANNIKALIDKAVTK